MAAAFNPAFTSKGILGELSGKKIERSVIIVPAANKNALLEFIRKNRIRYKIFDIWTDNF